MRKESKGMKNRKPRLQIEKRIDGITGGENLAAGIGIEIKDSKINLKPAGTRYVGYDPETALGGIYIDRLSSYSYKCFNVTRSGALELLPAGSSNRGGVQVGNSLRADVNGVLNICPLHYAKIGGVTAYKREFLLAGKPGQSYNSRSNHLSKVFVPNFTVYKTSGNGDDFYEVTNDALGGPYQLTVNMDETGRFEFERKHGGAEFGVYEGDIRFNFENWSGAGIVFCLETIVPPGFNAPLYFSGTIKPNWQFGYAVMDIYTLTKSASVSGSDRVFDGYTLDETTLPRYLYPFKSSSEFNKALGF